MQKKKSLKVVEGDRRLHSDTLWEVMNLLDLLAARMSGKIIRDKLAFLNLNFLLLKIKLVITR